MRRWEKGIQPLEIAENQCPEWIIFKNVPPDVISIEGVSWLCSLIGKPLRKFIREGLDVKACIIRDKAIPCPEKLSIEMEDDEIVSIEVVQVKPGEYNVGQKRVWRVVQDQRKPTKEPLKQDVPIILDSEGIVRVTGENDKVEGTETPMGTGKANAEVSSVPQASKKKSKKKKKKSQKRLGSAMDSAVEEGGSQPTVVPEDDGNTGNVPEPLLQGVESPTIAIISHEAESPPDSGLQGDENESGKVTSEEEPEISRVRKKATFDEFLQYSRPAKQKRKLGSGVQTRFKHNRR
ncbi:hypothetical protein LINPERPRIM_LOCUS32026 [Linum perenne]